MINEPTLTLNKREMSYTHITPSNQNELSILLRTNITQKEIAFLLKKDRTTIWRERKRNTGENGKYDARKAKKGTTKRQEEAHQQQRKIENNRWLQRYIVARIKDYWSPEQISGRLKLLYPNDKKKQIGKDCIYEYIYSKRRDLVKFLRCQKGKYRRRYGTRILEKAREEAKKKRIDTRPDEVTEKKVVGHWEGDTIVGSDKNHILTHNERKSGKLFAHILKTPTAEETRKVTVAMFKNIPKDKKRSVTYDNGVTFAHHELTEEQTKVSIYFAFPYHSWERGCNENSNGLLRQYFPKKTPLGKVTKLELKKAVCEINRRPRKRHGYYTPNEIYNKK